MFRQDSAKLAVESHGITNTQIEADTPIAATGTDHHMKRIGPGGPDDLHRSPGSQDGTIISLDASDQRLEGLHLTV